MRERKRTEASDGPREAESHRGEMEKARTAKRKLISVTAKL